MSDRNLGAAALMFALVACFAPDHASAYCRMRAGSAPQVGNEPCPTEGAPLFWKNACLSYAIDRRASSSMDYADVQDAVDLSFASWQDANCGGGTTPSLIFEPLQASTCRRPEFNENGPNVNTIAFLNPWRNPCADADDPSYSQFAFAVTIVWHNTVTGEIFDADMMINDQEATGSSAGGPYADCPDTGCLGNDADLQSIVTHEAGHFIGIGHSPDLEATMFAAADRGSIEKRTLEQDDRDAVCDIYPVGSSLDPESCAPIGGLQLNCEVTDSGNPIACNDPTNGSSSGGCSASGSPTDAPWVTLLVALLGLTWLRRRSGRHGVRS